MPLGKTVTSLSSERTRRLLFTKISVKTTLKYPTSNKALSSPYLNVVIAWILSIVLLYYVEVLNNGI